MSQGYWDAWRNLSQIMRSRSRGVMAYMREKDSMTKGSLMQNLVWDLAGRRPSFLPVRMGSNMQASLALN